MKLDALLWLMTEQVPVKKQGSTKKKQKAGQCLHCTEKAEKLGCCQYHYNNRYYDKLKKMPLRLRRLFTAECIAEGVILESRQGQGGGPKRKVS